MHYDVLGPLRIGTADGPVPIGSAKQRRVLAVLLAHAGSVVSADRLIAALWGDDPPSSALQTLRTYVYRLRDTLGGSVIATAAPGYLLDVEVETIDAGRFERLVAGAREESDPRLRVGALERALGLWRGPAYAEFADLDAVRPEAIRLEELRRVAAEERFDGWLALGQHAAVVGELEAFVHQHPLRERARGQLMLALHRSGRSADALASFREHRELLADELGLEVTASLEALERDILQRDPALDAPPGAYSSSPAASGTSPATWHAGVPEPVANPPPGELPAETSSLFGRDEEMTRIRAEMAAARLVTVTGLGGVGKTRVALRAARLAQTDHPDGVWWCDLAAVDGPDQVAAAVATTLGRPPAEDRDAATAVVAYLRARRSLLVLDNAEHVAASLAPLAARLLTSCPELTLLVTSRVPLRVPGEQLHPLPPLPVGDVADPGPALALFLARCHAVRPELQVDANERARMAGICHRLEGLPLAIELAASRLRSLNPGDLADRLDDGLSIISDPSRSTDRHRGLEAVVDWSFRLLTRAEQLLFCRLAVFAGPFALEAAEEVAGGDGLATAEIVDLLTRLVDHSLVTVLPTGGSTRYRLLEPLREYGLERLRQLDGGGTPIRARHVRYHVQLAEDADAQIRGRQEAIGVSRLDRTIDNLRAAHGWTIEQGEVDAAMRLAAALFAYGLWRLRAEVFEWVEAALRLPGADTHPSYPVVAGAAGWAAGLRGDLLGAAHWAQLGLDTVDDPADPRTVVPLEVLMHTALWQGHLDDCLSLATRAAAAVQDPYDLMPRYVTGLALTYAGRADEAQTWMQQVRADADRHGNPTMQAVVRYAQGEALLVLDPAAAIEPLEEAASLAASVGNRMVLGVVDVSLVSVEARHGDPRAALDTFVAVIDRLHAGGDLTHLWTGLRGLVDVLAQLGRDEDAGVLLGSVRDVDKAPPVYGDDAERLDEIARTLAQRIGADALAAAERRGRLMSHHDAIVFARSAIASARPRSPDEPEDHAEASTTVS